MSPRLNKTRAPEPGSSGLDVMFFSASVTGSQSNAAARGSQNNSNETKRRGIRNPLRIGLLLQQARSLCHFLPGTYDRKPRITYSTHDYNPFCRNETTHTRAGSFTAIQNHLNVTERSEPNHCS